MKSREELRTDYEEALFAVIMEDLMELQGAVFAAAEQRLSAADGEVTEAVDKRCAAYIKALTHERGRKGVWMSRLWKLFLMAVIVPGLCFAVADHFTMNPADFNAPMPFEDEVTETKDSEYSFTEVPESYQLIEELKETDLDQRLYSDGTGYILIRIKYSCGETEHSVDVEQAESVQDMDVNGFKGILVKKDNRVHLAITDTKNGNFIDVIYTDVSDEVVEQMMARLQSRE